ncbi:MAG: cupredoxin domain-containing protein [Candidatus Kerfeldbacteria bacterium]|nr:cupredoxin domain-containing protein [Candidatus Kerfeldbacteria bacterium]
MHKLLSISATAIATLALLGAGCTSGTTTTNTAATNIAPTTTTTNTATTTTTITNTVTAATKTFDISASQFTFEPSTITVNTDDTVVLNITSQDVPHGFSLPDFGVSETLTPGKTTTVEFVADKAGTYSFSCSVVCGSGHATMKGTLVVE